MTTRHTFLLCFHFASFPRGLVSYIGGPRSFQVGHTHKGFKTKQGFVEKDCVVVTFKQLCLHGRFICAIRLWFPSQWGYLCLSCLSLSCPGPGGTTGALPLFSPDGLRPTGASLGSRLKSTTWNMWDVVPDTEQYIFFFSLCVSESGYATT